MSDTDNSALAPSQGCSLEDLLKAQTSAGTQSVVRDGGDTVAVSFTLIESTTALTKRISRNADVSLSKINSAPLSRGVARRKSLRGSPTAVIKQFADALAAIGPNEAVVCAPPPAGPDEQRIVARKHLAENPGAIARTRENFRPVSGPALLMLDFDLKEFSEELNIRISEHGGLLKSLASVYQPLADAASVARRSASAGILEGGRPADTGMHRYYIVQDGKDAERFVTALSERLMLKGFLWGKITEAGFVDPRTLFDVAASRDTSRLCYEGDAVLGEGVAYVPGARQPVERSGGLLDTSQLASLSDAERAALNAGIAELRLRLEPQASAQRERWRTARVAELVAKGKEPKAARVYVDRVRETQTLGRDSLVHLDNGKTVTVDDILRDPQEYHKATCADPFEPDYHGGHNIAVIHTDKGHPNIFSHAHGGIEYKLESFRAEDWFTSSSGVAVVCGAINPQPIGVREWLVAPRLPVGDVTQAVGAPGVSKSTFALRDALVMATEREDLLRGVDKDGKPISHERLHKGGPVVVYNAEDRLDEMKRRLVAAQRYYGIADADMKHPIVLWSGVEQQALVIMQRTERRGPLGRAPGADTLESMICDYKAVLVVLDPQISLSRGAFENDNDDQNDVLQELANIAARTQTAIVVVHHTAKHTQDSAGEMGAGRGGFAAVGKVRSAFTIMPVTGERPDEREWGVTKADGLIRIDQSKLSHDKMPNEPIVFRRISVPVGNGNGIRPSTAAALFIDNPREALRVAGDQAPVLEVVDLRALKMKAQHAKVGNDAAVIAGIVDRLMGEVDERRLNDIVDAVGEQMRAQKIISAKTQPRIKGAVTANLGGPGVTITRGGRAVCVRVFQKTGAETSPWFVARTASDSESIST